MRSVELNSTNRRFRLWPRVSFSSLLPRAGRFGPLLARALPGEEPDKGQHQRAQHREDQACIEERDRVVFTKVGQQDPWQERSQDSGHLRHRNTRTGEFRFLFKVIGHLRDQRFIRHQNHGVDDIEDQIGQQVVPEIHLPNPHQGVAEDAGNTEQNKEFATAKAFAQPGGAKVIG